MMSSALSQQPRLGDSTPLALLHLSDLHFGGDLLSLLGAEGREHADPEPIGERILSAHIDVPSGEWIIWPDASSAMWIGARTDALPGPVRQRLTHGNVDDVITFIDSLADAGVWCREAALLMHDGWTRPRRSDAVFAALASRLARAISGVFVDRLGQVARLEISQGPVCWTDRPTLAIQWLLKTVDLPLPT